jgi:hypothetical protein
MGAFTQALQSANASQQVMMQRQQQEMAMAQAKQQQEQARMQQQALSELANNPNPTARDYARVSTLIPSMSKQLNETWQLLAPEQQRGRLDVGYQAMAAVRAGKPELAAELLNTQADAASRSGDKQGAEGYANWSKILTMDPDGGSKTLGLMLSQIDPKFADNYDKLTATESRQTMAPLELREKSAAATIREAEAGVAGEKAKLALQKLGAEIGLTNAQITQARAAAAASNAAAEKDRAPPSITPKEKFEAESKLRKEYSEQTKNYSDVAEAYSRLRSANDDGPGDIALIFSYMKMLDPGSVVREGEFATAANSGGIPTGVVNIYNRMLSGKFLTRGQRKTFTGQAAAFHDSALEKERVVRATLEPVARAYGLDAKNIFYGPPPKKESSAKVTDETRAVPIPGQAPRPIKVDF